MWKLKLMSHRNEINTGFSGVAFGMPRVHANIDQCSHMPSFMVTSPSITIINALLPLLLMRLVHWIACISASWTSHLQLCPQWASYQIDKFVGCACAGNAGNVSPRRRFQRKPLVSDPGMHHGTCVTHVPWCMSGSLTCGDGENVPGIPGACATCNFTYLARGPLSECLVCLHALM